jgi:hypothetical protein
MLQAVIGPRFALRNQKVHLLPVAKAKHRLIVHLASAGLVSSYRHDSDYWRL